MRSKAPPLLPILRSRTQAGILAILLLNRELELTQTELASRVGNSLTSVIDEVRRLENAGILHSRTLGRSRLVRAGDGPLVESLADVVMRAFGPVQIVTEEFRPVVDEFGRSLVMLALFGSWAARYRGEDGRAPADVDVLLVVSEPGADREPVYAAADRAQRRLGKPVNPTMITERRWEARGSGQDAFVDEIAARPLVVLQLGGPSTPSQVS